MWEVGGGSTQVAAFGDWPHVTNDMWLDTSSTDMSCAPLHCTVRCTSWPVRHCSWLPVRFMHLASMHVMSPARSHISFTIDEAAHDPCASNRLCCFVGCVQLQLSLECLDFFIFLRDLPYIRVSKFRAEHSKTRFAVIMNHVFERIELLNH